MIVPLELLQHLGPTDFASQRDFVRWKRRQLALLEEGLIHCSGDPPPSDGVPSLLSRKSEGDMTTSRLRTLLSQMQRGEADSQDPQTKQALRMAVLSKAEKQVRHIRGFRVYVTGSFLIRLWYFLRMLCDHRENLAIFRVEYTEFRL